MKVLDGVVYSRDREERDVGGIIRFEGGLGR